MANRARPAASSTAWRKRWRRPAIWSAARHVLVGAPRLRSAVRRVPRHDRRCDRQTEEPRRGRRSWSAASVSAAMPPSPIGAEPSGSAWDLRHRARARRSRRWQKTPTSPPASHGRSKLVAAGKGDETDLFADVAFGPAGRLYDRDRHHPDDLPELLRPRLARRHRRQCAPAQRPRCSGSRARTIRHRAAAPSYAFAHAPANRPQPLCRCRQRPSRHAREGEGCGSRLAQGCGGAVIASQRALWERGLPAAAGGTPRSP